MFGYVVRKLIHTAFVAFGVVLAVGSWVGHARIVRGLAPSLRER